MNRSGTRISAPRAVGAALLVGGLAVGVTLGTRGAATPAAASTGALKQFGGCDEVLAYFQKNAADHLIDRAGGDRRFFDLDFYGAEPASGAATAEDSGGGSSDHSTTNVQEAGVDEPDLVKTDGTRIVAVAQDRVHLVAVQGGKMTRRATLPDAMVRDVFLSGDRLLVFSSRTAGDVEPGPVWPGQRAALSLYDIANLGDPRSVGTLTIDGDVLDARLVGNQVRVATAFSPDIDVPSPVYTRTGRLTRQSKDDLRAAVASSTVDDWIPGYTLRDGAGGLVGEGTLAECESLASPETFSGLDTVAVTSFDITSALASHQTAGVIAGGQQIYATGTSTYIATTEWGQDGSSSAQTSLHKFVTSPTGASSYRGTGAVPGTLLNSYAMSEYEGVLRVASTISGSRGWANPRSSTEGVVTTLQEQGGTLEQLGQVDGLGREDNESIRAVRFIEERAYVVTFRQTDPLYVLDLGNPAAPEVTGELKIPGYSGYLHPVGQGRLLGVGQSGEREVQFSLFDTSKPTAPRRLDTLTYAAGEAGAEFDPRAFLYWEPRNLILAPTTLHGNQKGKGAFSGLMLLRTGAKGLTEVGRIGVTESDDLVRRSVVIGDVVYLLSDQALKASSLDTYQTVDTLTF